MAIPVAPSNVVLQTGNQKNLVSWDLVTGVNAATSYQVQRSLDGVTFTNLGAAVTTNSLIDAAVAVGTAYFYQVNAINGSGPSVLFTPSFPPSITPCLPGQINLGYLRYMSQLRADKLHSQYLTTDEWNWNIGQSANELYDILVTKYGDNFFLAPPLFIPLTGLNSYPLPDGALYSGAPAMYKLSGIDSNIGGGVNTPNAGWVPISRSNWSDRDRYTTFPGQAGALNNIYQMSYREMGNDLWIFPANQNMTIRLFYVPILKQMLLDTDMLPFSISGWSEYVIVDAAMKAMVKEESLEKWNALSALKGQLLERIETTAANRDVSEPNSVSNIRATSGDPGFSNFNGGFGGSGWGSGFSFVPFFIIPYLLFHYEANQSFCYAKILCETLIAIYSFFILSSNLFNLIPSKFISCSLFRKQTSFLKNHIFRIVSGGA